MDLDAARGRLSPPQLTDLAPAESQIRRAESQLLAVQPEKLCGAMQIRTNRISGRDGAIKSRAQLRELFACELAGLRSGFHAIVTEKKLGARKIGARALAQDLNCVLERSWDIDTMQASLNVLDHVIPELPLKPQDARVTLTDELDHALLSFNDGQVRSAVQSLRDLLTTHENSTNLFTR